MTHVSDDHVDRGLGLALVLALALAGCLGPETAACPGGGVCPPGLICAVIDDQQACVLATCGDGQLDLGEACDDGSDAPGDACPSDCSEPCGNGRLELGEVCDDGNLRDGDGCASTCQSDERCGNGHLDRGSEACDDGNLRNHDGCASDCAAETPAWTHLDALPPGRAGQAMVYDAGRGRLVVFGGCAGTTCAGGVLNDTWEWDGTTWHERTPPISPRGRFGHAMAYDANRKLVVMYGGCSGTATTVARCDGELDDTWVWDGTTWARQFPAGRPLPLSGAAMVYSPEYGLVLMFGGTSGGFASNETWFLNATTWSNLSLPSPPPPRAHHALVYDPVRHTIVLFGGVDGAGALRNDTWEWSYPLERWVVRAPLASPPARAFHGLVADPRAGRVRLIGGCGAIGGPTGCSEPLDDLWTWDGARWSDTTPPARPSPRAFASVVHHAGRGHAILLGGRGAAALAADLWELDGLTRTRRMPFAPTSTSPAMTYDAPRGTLVLYDGADVWESNDGTWHLRTAVPRPPARLYASLTHDTTRHQSVLFSGIDQVTGRMLDDTWTWDGVRWTARHPTTIPAGRWQHATAFDPARRRLVMFGGYRGEVTDETWEWDGTNWLRRNPAVSPPARYAAAMAYDVARRRVVLFGGNKRNGELDAYDDTWEWDGESWVERHPLARPRPRFGHTMAYDPHRETIVLHAGSVTTDSVNVADDTWQWNGVNWFPIAVSLTPGPRRGHTMAYDGVHQRMVVHGAEAFLGAAARETWAFTYESPLLDDRCDGSDGDGDGVVACADPDCGGRCDPVCDVTSPCDDPPPPRCGDGVCDVLEDCRLCPVDCGACPAVCGDWHCDPGETCNTCGDCSCF